MKIYYGEEKITVKSQLPLLTLRDIVIYPHMVYPLLVGRQFTIAALQEALILEKHIFLCAQKFPDIELPTEKDYHHCGVVARILQVVKLPNGTMKVLVEGLMRARAKTIEKSGTFFTVKLEFIKPDPAKDSEIQAISRRVKDLFTEYVYINRRIPDEILLSFSSVDNPQRLADLIAAHVLLKLETKQEILEIRTVRGQLEKLADVLQAEIEILKIEQKIDGNVREALSKDQKEFYLQKQLKVIKEELGQADENANEVEDLLDKLDKLDASKEVKDKAQEEISRLAKMHPYSAESAVARAYIEWILGLPWNFYTFQPTLCKVSATRS